MIDALDLFDTVLQCQRRRHGHLHPDVASALHNVGIAQLRAQNHNEALKAFEEAARIRKGALGREHAQVAVSICLPFGILSRKVTEPNPSSSGIAG